MLLAPVACEKGAAQRRGITKCKEATFGTRQVAPGSAQPLVWIGGWKALTRHTLPGPP